MSSDKTSFAPIQDPSVMPVTDDRDVDIKGGHLRGRKIEFVVTGGIACIESPRIIRELRRYGASVRVWMTKAATEFVSPRVFEWASKEFVITDLTGAAEHITHADAVLIAPATLDFISKISLGLADAPALTMIQSAIGRRPIFLIPSMHESLANNPIHQAHLSALSKISRVEILESARAEAKLKMPAPEEVVARISHSLSRSSLKSIPITISVGPTRSYADDIRFLSNRSSGALGLAIADELYRRGADVAAVCGPLSVFVPPYISTTHVETREEMLREFLKVIERAGSASRQIAIFSAAVLDFEITQRHDGKVSSKSAWTLELKATPKLIQSIQSKGLIKVAFKLESATSDAELKAIGERAAKDNDAEFMIANRFEDVSIHEHRAWLWNRKMNLWIELKSKADIASVLAEQLEIFLDQNRDSTLNPSPLPADPEVRRI